MPFTTFKGPVNTVEGTEGGDLLGGLNINKNVRVNGLGAIDTLNVIAKNGGDFNAISIYGNAGADKIAVGSTITGSLLQGGGGGDAITANTSNTELTVRGGSGQDGITAVTGGNKSIFNGNKEHDSMFVGNTFINSSIYGGEGNDTINVLDGILDNSSISGDKGNDNINDQGEAITLTLRGNSGIYGNDGDDTINFQTTLTAIFAQGGNGNDTITGSTVADTLNGGADDDTFLYASRAAFIDETGAADEVIDLVNGGSGTNDTVSIGGNALIRIGQNGNDTLARATNVERLTRSAAGITTITGGSTERISDFRIFDFALGGANTQSITMAGVDVAVTIIGGVGNDLLSGGQQIDNIQTGNGVNAVQGNEGADIITLGTQNLDTDTVTFSELDQYGDVITNFASGNNNDIMQTVGNAAVTGAGFAEPNAASAVNTATTGIVVLDANTANAGTLTTANLRDAFLSAGGAGFANIAANTTFYGMVSTDATNAADAFVYRITADGAGTALASSTLAYTLKGITDMGAFVAGNFDTN